MPLAGASVSFRPSALAAGRRNEARERETQTNNDQNIPFAFSYETKWPFVEKRRFPFSWCADLFIKGGVCKDTYVDPLSISPGSFVSRFPGCFLFAHVEPAVLIRHAHAALHSPLFVDGKRNCVPVTFQDLEKACTRIPSLKAAGIRAVDGGGPQSGAGYLQVLEKPR